MEQGASPTSGRACCCKLADLVEQAFRRAGRARHARHGRADQPHQRQPRCASLGMLRYYAGQATAIHGETIENSLPGEYRLLHAEGAGRRRRRHHPVERPADRHDLEDRPGARHRLHGGAQAGRGGAADAAAPRRAVPGGRRARRASSTSCRATARPPARRSPRIRDVDKVAFTGSHRDRPEDRPGLGRQPEARLARARRQVARHRLRRRRPRRAPCRARRWPCSPTPARSAAPARGCSSSARSTTSSSSGVADVRQALRVGDGLDPDDADRPAGLGSSSSTASPAISTIGQAGGRAAARRAASG